MSNRVNRADSSLEHLMPHVMKSVSVHSVINSLKRSDLTEEHREHLLLLLQKLVQHGLVFHFSN